MRIGEVADATGTTTKTLRFYETTGLMQPPTRTAGGYRDYPADAVQRVHFIRRSRAAGLTLAQIREVLALRDAGTAPCHHVQQTLLDRLRSLDEQIAELTRLRDTVAKLSERAAHPDPATCDPASVCRYL